MRISLGLAPYRLRPWRLFRSVLAFLAVLYVVCYIFIEENGPATWMMHTVDTVRGRAPPRMSPPRPIMSLGPRVPCYGPRGQLLSNSSDDALTSAHLSQKYPVPFAGSHEELGLEKSWMSPDGRYGPYGFGEEDKSYSRTVVDWDTVDWGLLQNDCFALNAHRFTSEATKFLNNPVRFAWKSAGTVPEDHQWTDFSGSRRTAIILRAYDGYDYKKRDMQHIRSLIVEASLRTGGEYVVVLLVHIRSEEFNPWNSPEEYARAFEHAKIPKELQSIAVLWNEPLLESWYPETLEHRTFWQAFQPLQLFSHYYPEFDHYWQFEMDMRFTGDAGAYLDAVDLWSRKEPRKQAMERSTFFYDPTVFNTTDEFRAAVDEVNRGRSHVWGPVRVREVSPIGPRPPTTDEEDNFEWGVGEDADVIVTSLCADARKSTTWIFRGWVYGFRAGKQGPPRYFCPPAIQRGSRALLHAVHTLQRRGLRIASEATLPSFALWLGLKISAPPLPWYLNDVPDDEERARWMLGGPKASDDGFGKGDPQWGQPDMINSPQMSSTFWWAGGWPGELFEGWLQGKKTQDGKPMYPLTESEGQLYMPNLLLHPVKRE
ncbi:hypothetical protein VD0002_g1457 [Verticillium dahliae]|uniref:Uncharacterized protein n=2 Tax=Verticillium dahliae TaxID=27337 RepID=G2WZ08_VERDV|nr:uncharacterized protein VDAG_03250 [Verticillium dahliae VdLs.17]KAH6703643.1 hypothetical protein EV126DRAFT_212834 [Verticillium dahliae]EGY21810.1 hypothetical protein VDAG_03250 [Verticillium dahliae VdLs.17]PNH28863.1 hypothetical protein BJF96_g7816 [Verticillium dahliae]PNH57183.1 hypothetical protein VD0003_g610 [Verticillium dahliae]PNH63486.1 hypothetical protein VD0001_g9120 [Verticillium dahliae]